MYVYLILSIERVDGGRGSNGFLLSLLAGRFCLFVETGGDYLPTLSEIYHTVLWKNATPLSSGIVGEVAYFCCLSGKI